MEMIILNNNLQKEMSQFIRSINYNFPTIEQSNRYFSRMMKWQFKRMAKKYAEKKQRKEMVRQLNNYYNMD